MQQSPAVFKNNISVFASKLLEINSGELLMSDYSKRYLTHLITHRNYYLCIYAHVLENVLKQSEKGAEEICLVDYGAGNGMLGIFAKFCGFKKVCICDIDADFILASKLLANELNILVDEFITGDIKLLQASLLEQTVDAIAGTDVIEHIYNLDNYFSIVKQINPDMVTVFTTASNPDNFIKTKQLRKLQIKDELEGSEPGDFVLAGAEKHEAFLTIRQKIIETNFSHLSKDNILLLAKATRGLYKPDIIIAVQNFIGKGILLNPDEQDLNTCNPITGSWTERILSIELYRVMYKKNGFSLSIKNGFYNSSADGMKKYLNTILNLAIRIFGKKIAPFITLVGYREN